MINDQGTELKSVPSRTLEDIKKEYATICGSAGDLSYMCKEFEAKLEMVHQHLFNLKKEYKELEEKANVSVPVAQDAHEVEGHPFSETKAP